MNIAEKKCISYFQQKATLLPFFCWEIFLPNKKLLLIICAKHSPESTHKSPKKKVMEYYLSTKIYK